MSLVPGPIQEKLDQIEILNLFKVQAHSPVVPWLEQNRMRYPHSRHATG